MIHSAFVLGSTSSVAIAITQALAQNGCKRFHLVARDPGRNQDLADSLKARWNVEVTTETCDLLQCTDINSPYLPKLTEDFDLYLVTAGYLGDAELACTDPAEAL